MVDGIKNFEFGIPQKLFFGQGSLKQLGEILIMMKAKGVFIISGPHLNKMGVVIKVADICIGVGVSVDVFTKTEANPSIETVKSATKAYKESGADCIIALGGGSPMDVAKAVGVVARYGGCITEYEGGGKVPGEIIPIIAIPTTAGTGSEVTTFSVITDHSRNYKFTVFSEWLLPSYAILDPDFITSVPANIAAATGVDAMVHAIEAYISKASNPFTDCMAEKALELLGANIREFVSDRSNMKAAGAMLLGSTFAGVAFNLARLGNVHAMAHPVGGFFNVAHGVANAILLPICMEYNAITDDGKYKKIYEYISLRSANEDFNADILVEEIRNMTKALGIPQSLSEVGVTKDRIPAMAKDAMKSGNILVNPRNTGWEDVIRLYELAM